MKPERWRRVEELYHAALREKVDQRPRFLETEAAGDEDLRREVESLLALQERSESFLETTALQATVQMVAGDQASIEGEDQLLTSLFGSELGSGSSELMVTTPQGHTRALPLKGRSLSLGRSPENDLSFPEDEGLSRQHLVIESEGRRWTVRDLESKNGTLVNGKRLTRKTLLQPGDRISASCITLTFRGPAFIEDTE